MLLWRARWFVTWNHLAKELYKVLIKKDVRQCHELKRLKRCCFCWRTVWEIIYTSKKKVYLLQRIWVRFSNQREERKKTNLQGASYQGKKVNEWCIKHSSDAQTAQIQCLDTQMIQTYIDTKDELKQNHETCQVWPPPTVEYETPPTSKLLITNTQTVGFALSNHKMTLRTVVKIWLKPWFRNLSQKSSI